jgi:hypothetical protein
MVVNLLLATATAAPTIKKLQKTLPEVGRRSSGPIPKFVAFAARSDTNFGIKGSLATL